MIVFSAEKGRVSRVLLSDEQKIGTITFPDLNYAQMHVIFDAVGMSFTPSYQISDTLGGDILLMTFGESISPATLRGTVLMSVCGESTDTDIGPNAGLRGIIEWWHSKNLASTQLPIQITVDTNNYFSVFVADMKLGVEETEQRLWRFALTLLRVPPAKLRRPDDLSSVSAPQILPTNAGLGPVQSSRDITPTPTTASFVGFDPPNRPLVGPISGL